MLARSRRRGGGADVAPVAPQRVEHGAARTVGGVGIFAGAEALDLMLCPPQVGDGVELLDADLLELEVRAGGVRRG